MIRFRRRVRTRPITTRRKVLYALLVALPLLGILTFSSRGILKRIDLENRSADLRRQLYSDRATGDSLRLEIRRATSDTATIERIARERYGMIRPGETLYRIDE